MGWTMVIVTVVFALSLAALWRRGLQLRDLVNDGVPLTAKVEKIWTFKGRQKARLRFSYQVDNENYTRAVAISMAEYEQLQQGDSVAIVYLPSKPSVSALDSMVSLAKQGLNKTK